MIIIARTAAQAGQRENLMIKTTVKKSLLGDKQSSSFIAPSLRGKIPGLLVKGFLLVGLSSGAIAQTEAAADKAVAKKRTLEEVIVTAQKREQVEFDVPVSMSVMSDTFMKEQGLTSVQDALEFVPNFKIITFANIVIPQCRGFIVSQQNAAFEAPCGLALDGVAFSRSVYFSAGLFDLQRMEVLRGPQGTTFGKNTTAGVVSLYSKDPSEEFTANISLQNGLSGPDVERVELGIGGPIVEDFMNFRIAGATEEREGAFENTYHETDPSEPDRLGGIERSQHRVKLGFPNLFGTNLKLLHEETSFEPQGTGIKLLVEEDSALGQYVRQYDPNYDFGRNWRASGFGADGHLTELKRSQLDWSADIGEWGVTLVGAVGEIDNRVSIEFLPWPQRWVRADNTENSPFETFELRTVSPEFEGLFGLDSLFGINLGNSNFLAGIFTQETELNTSAKFLLRHSPTAGIVAAAAGVYVPDKQALDLQRDLGLATSETAQFLNSQTTKSDAIFAQFIWNMTQTWSLELSGRYTDETKTATWDNTYSTPAPVLDTDGTGEFHENATRSETGFQPKVTVGFRPTDNINVFLHWAKAFKAGGFNFGAVAQGGKEGLAFDQEVGTDWGIDVKTVLLDNTLKANLSLFRLTVDDFQVLTAVPGDEVPGTTARIPNGYSQVINAASARAQGVEIDLQYLPTEWLTVIGSVGYNDTEYLDYTLATCSSREEPDPETGRCDHTGYAFSYSPKLSTTLSLDFQFPLNGLWEILGDTRVSFGGTVSYTDDSLASENGDPCCVQESYYLYRAHVGVNNRSQGWDFRVTGLNLTNEYILPNQSDDAALPSGSPAPPRSVFAQFSWNY